LEIFFKGAIKPFLDDLNFLFFAGQGFEKMVVTEIANGR